MTAIKEENNEVKRKGLLDLTIREAQKLGVNLSDIFAKDGVTMNMSWGKIMKTINYLAGQDILTRESTLQEVLDTMPNFL